MAAPNRPFASTLPGISELKLPIDTGNRTATFTDRQGQSRTLHYHFAADEDGVCLTVTADDGSICSFTPWPPRMKSSGSPADSR